MKKTVFMILCFSRAMLAQTDQGAVALATEAEIKASVHLSTFEVPQNRPLTYTIKVSWKGELSRFEIGRIETPMLTGLKLLSNASSNWVGSKDGSKSAVKTYEFILEPQEMGMAYIDGAVIEYTDSNTGAIEKLATNRVEIKVIEPVIERDLTGMFVMGSGVLAVLAAVFIIRRVIANKKRREADRLLQEAANRPLEAIYLEKLKQTVDLSAPTATQAFSSLSGLVRKYLAESYDFPALGLSTIEISGRLAERGVASGLKERIEEILNTCDVAKFAGTEVDKASLERAYTMAEQVFEDNRVSHEKSVH